MGKHVNTFLSHCNVIWLVSMSWVAESSYYISFYFLLFSFYFIYLISYSFNILLHFLFSGSHYSQQVLPFIFTFIHYFLLIYFVHISFTFSMHYILLLCCIISLPQPCPILFYSIYYNLILLWSMGPWEVPIISSYFSLFYFLCYSSFIVLLWSFRTLEGLRSTGRVTVLGMTRRRPKPAVKCQDYLWRVVKG